MCNSKNNDICLSWEDLLKPQPSDMLLDTTLPDWYFDNVDVGNMFKDNHAEKHSVQPFVANIDLNNGKDTEEHENKPVNAWVIGLDFKL